MGGGQIVNDDRPRRPAEPLPKGEELCTIVEQEALRTDLNTADVCRFRGLGHPQESKSFEGSTIITICFSTVAVPAAYGLWKLIYPILCAPHYGNGLPRDASKSYGWITVVTAFASFVTALAIFKSAPPTDSPVPKAPHPRGGSAAK